MASYQILYWQDIPSQIKLWDDFDEEKIELPQKFMIKIDQVAKEQGLTSEDDYLLQWRWGEEQELSGTINEVAEHIKKELEQKFNT
jgi:metal-responsive CopG/Arc/MetJ family transcriptional regulator